MKKIFTLLSIITATVASWAAAPEHLYVVGSGCAAGWDTKKALEMTTVSEGVYTWTGILDASGEFKFLPERSWSTSYTCQIAQNGNETVVSGQTYPLYTRGEHEGADNKFVVAVSGTYDVTVNLNEMTMVCVLQGEIVSLKITGDACSCGWSTGGALSLTPMGDNQYTITTNLTAGKHFRFLTGNGWYPTYTTAVADQPVEDGTYALTYFETQPDGEPAFLVATGGNYTLTVDLDLFTLTMVRNEEQLYMIGNALTGKDGNWDYADAQKFDFDAATETFTWAGRLLAKTEGGNTAEFKFLKSNSGWDGYVSSTPANITVTIGETYPIRDSSGNPDSKFIVPEDGNYIITASLADMTMKIEKDINNGIDIVDNSGEDSVEVTATTGGILVSVAEVTDVAVYNAAAVKIVNKAISGQESISLPGGLYVVVAGGKGHKVVVR